MVGPGGTGAALALLRRDVGLAFAAGGSTRLALAFFAITVTLFPFGVGPGAETLARIAPGVIWVAALLASLLSLDRMFEADFEDGSLDLLAIGPLPLSIMVLMKAVAHWIATALPLVLLAPILAMTLRLENAAYPALIASLLIGTPALSFIGMIGAALTTGLRRAGVLLSLIVLPLYIPVLIFATGAINAARTGLDPGPHLMLLGASALLSLVLGCWAAAAALKLHLE